MSVYGLCPFCGNTKQSSNGTGSDVSCCGEVGHATKITTSDQGLGWIATDENYDGAPDSNSPIGIGFTEQAALDDLLEQLAEAA